MPWNKNDYPISMKNLDEDLGKGPLKSRMHYWMMDMGMEKSFQLP
ncbi:hypothetical protein [Peribacillus simplex]|uniref:Uncharacterized protein n=1 Tax=Peribacillus simplex TaxID=1478 RepID=A0AAW7ID65_9BACI|nr:hypothetical protein [Peribacillus simplex]MDM5453304.1 hypothetical protein [Peribacillus simplex]